MVRARALVGIVAISFSAILVRASGVSPGTSAFARVAWALPALVVAWLVVRDRDHRDRRGRLLAFAAGLLFSLDLAAWHRSIDLLGAGLATVLGNTQVLFVGLLAWLALGERPRRAAFVAVPVALVGVVLVSGVGSKTAYGADPRLGAILATLTGLFYAAFLLVFRRSNVAQAPTPGPLLDATLGAVVGTLVLAPLDPGFTVTPPTSAWLPLALLALGAQTGGWLLIAHALPRLPALTTSVLLLLQPCLAVVWGYLIFMETPGPLQWAGVGLVVAAIAVHEAWKPAGKVAPPQP